MNGFRWLPMLPGCCLLVLAGCTLAPTAGSEMLRESAVQVHFTDPLAPAGGTELATALARFLEAATATLDVAIYHLRDSKVEAALGRLCARGVHVRMVVDRDAMLDSVARISEVAPCAHVRVHDAAGLMHHKFAVADEQAVWTGSANWTASGLTAQANNALWIRNAAVASAYSAEFQRLYAYDISASAVPAANPIRWGDLAVHVFFSPDKQIENELIRWIQTAQHSIRLAMYYYTNDRLHKALLDALTRGVRIEALWDRQGWQACDHSEVDEMLSLGVGEIAPLSALLHHKFTVIDGSVLITGSANWTGSAFSQNAENVFIIEDPTLAGLYEAEFGRVLQDAVEYQTDPDSPWRLREAHFNTVPGSARLEWHSKRSAAADGYQICRLSVSGTDCEQTYQEVRPHAWYFVDRNVQPDRIYRYRLRVSSGGRWQDVGPDLPVEVSGDRWPMLTESDIRTLQRDGTGQPATVSFAVNEVHASKGGNVFINSDPAYGQVFTTFIPACASERFEALGVDVHAYGGHALRVSGDLGWYRGPEIVVYDPGQIEVLLP